jgi:serine/threonine protein kinase
MKNPQDMQQLEDLFHEALELKPADRADFIERIRTSNSDLGAAVESLIAAHEQPDGLIDAVAYEAAPEMIAEAPPALVAGQLVGHYKIIKPLGKGGMGEVYLAGDTKLDRKVALKLLPKEFTNHKDLLRRFIQEARAASSLNHPNIITIHEIGQTDGTHYIATEFIDGLTLKQHMRLGRLEFAEVLDVSIQVASALEAAHAAGLVHRDIKPDNIMLRPDGIVKVLDFGLAKLTQKSEQSSVTEANSQIDTMLRARTRPGTIMGTIDYMSPEQARGKVLDRRTDVFSFGVVLYEMAAGRIPFSGATSADALVSILDKEPAPLTEYAPELPAEFERIVSKALRKDREERYQTIKDLLIDLKSLKEELTFAQKLERSRPPQSKVRASTGATESPVTEQTIAGAAATDQNAVAPATAIHSIQKRGHGRAAMVALALVLLAGLTIGGVALWRRSGSTPVISAPAPAPAPIPAVQRTISYWITVQKYRDGKPYQDPFRLSDNINFEKDYQLRLTLTSSQNGRLYLLNEGPLGADQTPTFNVMFPSTTSNEGSALLTKNQPVQIPEESWFNFDGQEGTEKIWLIWTEKEVPELEAVKGFANRKDRGVVSSPGLRTAVSEFLKAHSSSKPTVERNEDKKETVVRAPGEILVHVIKLEHH